MSGRLVLVDTSVWIDYFRCRTPSVEAEVDSLLDQDRVAVCSLVLAELLHGARSEKETRELKGHFSALHALREGPDQWIEAGMLAFAMKSRGKNLNLADCHLAAVAKTNDCLVYSLDRHFRLLASEKVVVLHAPASSAD